MPERDKAVSRVSADIIGARVFDGLEQRPRGVRKDVWNVLEALVDMAYVKVVQTTDWNRVILTASGRHSEMVDRYPDHKSDIMFTGLDDTTGDPICPDCIVWALLSETTSGGPTGIYRYEEAVIAMPKVPADWWHDWLYGEDGEGPGPAEALRILFPLIIEAAEALKVEPPDDE